MKTYLKLAVGMLFAFLIANSAVAQQGRGQGNGQGRGQGYGQGQQDCNLPDLTEAQQQQMEKLRTEHQKTMLAHHNQMGELQAKLRTLETADKADQNAIDATIDQMGKMRTDMQKKNAAHRQAIRSLLDEKQRLAFDSQDHRGRHHGEGMREGRGRRDGRGGRGMWRNNGDCPNNPDKD